LNRESIVWLEENHLAKVYHKRGIVVAGGKDATIWDVNGKTYVDCMGGYGTAFIGHSNPKVIEAIKKQVEKLLACHGSLYHEARAELLKRIVDIVPKNLSRVFLSNSGAESVELALKVSRKFTGRKELIAMMRSFHGKTLGALSVTWNSKYRIPFEPLIPKIKFVPFGKAESVRKIVSEDTAAIIVEPVQGESGVYVAPDGYLEELREIADENNLLLIFDEVQTGFGRTGKMFAFEHWGVEPDVLCLGKAVASGVPIGITVAKEEIMSTLKVGEHSSTSGGNPIACASACATIDVAVEERIWEKAEKLGSYFKVLLRGLTEKHKIVREVRGLGLMIGMDLRFDVLNIMQKMLERGVLVLDAGVNTLRFLPPCTITEKQIDFVVGNLEECLKEEEKSIFLI